MIIENGIQPNCSELVIRLDNDNIEDIKTRLEKIGIKEYMIKEYWEFLSPKGNKDWDSSTNIPNYQLYDDLPLEAQDCLEVLRDNVQDEDIEIYTKYSAILKEKYNIDTYIDRSTLVDTETHNPSDKIDLSLRRNYGFDDDGYGYMIEAHQHCDERLFPSLQKISEEFNCVVEGFDGGSERQYEDWCAGIDYEEDEDGE